MYRPFLLFVAALSVVAPASASAQSTEERDRERQRIERDRLQNERDADRERARAQRDRQRELDRQRAGTLDTTVVFDAKGTVSVSCYGGAVIVTGSERNEIRVRARTESGSIRFTSSGGRASLETSTGRGCSDGQFEITVPAGAKVTATTWSGSVSVRGVVGDVEAHAHSGEIMVRDAGDRVEVQSLSGDVVVAGVRGETSINTMSGDVELSGTRGAVQVETVSGDLDLRDVITRQLRVHTTNGDISFAGDILEGGRYAFNTHSGEIDLLVPGETGAELSVSTFNGAIESDFPITLKAGDHGIGAAQSKRLNFSVGRGTARITAETFSGDITIRRRR